MLNDLLKNQFYKFIQRTKVNYRIVEVYGIGIEKIFLADRIEKPNEKKVFRLIRAIDITELINKYSLSMNEKYLIDYIKTVNDFLFDKEFENFSYIEIQ